MPARSRPIGSITRGTTHPNRLRRFDRYLIHRAGRVLRGTDRPLVVDLGFGAAPTTTLELDRVLAQAVPSHEVIGIEIDPVRVAAAQRARSERVSFILGGLEISTQRRPQAIRAANVLRQYRAAEVGAAWELLASRLAPGGVLIEGTCDELGRLASWVTVEAGRARPSSWTMSVRLASLRTPGEVAARLPKALIHHNIPGQPVYELLAAADRAWSRAADRAVFSAGQRWLATVATLRESGVPVLDDAHRWRLGELTVPWDAVAPR